MGVDAVTLIVLRCAMTASPEAESTPCRPQSPCFQARIPGPSSNAQSSRHPDKSIACSSDVLVPAVEFEHVSVFAPGDRNLYVGIHFVVLRSCHASPLSAPLWLRDDRRQLGCRRSGTRNKSFATGLTGLGTARTRARALASGTPGGAPSYDRDASTVCGRMKLT
jgi:hypothetical protein